MRLMTRARPAETPDGRIACPDCTQRAGFLLELDGVSYKVLEDHTDTDLLHEAPPDAAITCLACKHVIRPADALRLAGATGRAVSLRTGEARRMGPRRGRVHPGGKAKRRTTADGRSLPMCPECDATHEFFVDLGGIAFKVLEDDDDTELIADATNLLCARCNAVFDL